MPASGSMVVAARSWPARCWTHRPRRLLGVRIFLAGPAGVIGTRLIPLLVADGPVVAGDRAS